MLDRNIVLSCRDIALFLCRDRGFPCHDRDDNDKRSGNATGLTLGRVFMLRHSLVNAESFHVTTEYFCVAIGFGKDQEFLCRDKIFLCHDRVGQGKENLCRDRGFCVMTEFGLDRGF